MEIDLSDVGKHLRRKILDAAAEDAILAREISGGGADPVSAKVIKQPGKILDPPFNVGG